MKGPNDSSWNKAKVLNCMWTVSARTDDGKQREKKKEWSEENQIENG